MRLNVIKIAASKQEAGKLCGNRLLGRQQGFTIVELITIIVILGIIAVAAAPRFFDRNVFDSRGFYDQVISTLRHAQKIAIAQRRFVCVQFSAVGVTPGSVKLTTGSTNSCGAQLTSPSGESPYEIKNNNASFWATYPDISFDCLGRPRNANTGKICSDTSATSGILTAPTPIRVNGYATDIIVEQETGYVH